MVTLIPGLESCFTEPKEPSFNSEFEAVYSRNLERANDGRTVVLQQNSPEVKRYFGILFRKGVRKYLEHLKLDPSLADDVLRQFYGINCNVTDSSFTPLDVINRELGGVELPTNEDKFRKLLLSKLFDFFTKERLDESIREATLQQGVNFASTRELNLDSLDNALDEFSKLMFSEDKHTLARKYGFDDISSFAEKAYELMASRPKTAMSRSLFQAYFADKMIGVDQNNRRRQSLYDSTYRPLHLGVQTFDRELSDKIRAYESIENLDDLKRFLEVSGFGTHNAFYEHVKTKFNTPNLEGKLFHFECIYREIKNTLAHKEQQQKGVPRRPRGAALSTSTQYSGSMRYPRYVPKSSNTASASRTPASGSTARTSTDAASSRSTRYSRYAPTSSDTAGASRTPASGSTARTSTDAASSRSTRYSRYAPKSNTGKAPMSGSTAERSRGSSRTGVGNQNQEGFTTLRSRISQDAVLHALSYSEINSMYQSNLETRDEDIISEFLTDFGLTRDSITDYLKAYKQDLGVDQGVDSEKLYRPKSDKAVISINRDSLPTRSFHPSLTSLSYNEIRSELKEYVDANSSKYGSAIECEEAYANTKGMTRASLYTYLEALRDDIELGNSVPKEATSRSILGLDPNLKHLSYNAIIAICNTVGTDKFMQKFGIPGRGKLGAYFMTLSKDAKVEQDRSKEAQRARQQPSTAEQRSRSRSSRRGM